MHKLNGMDGIKFKNFVKQITLLTFETSILYSFLTALRICGLLAFISTTKTKVFVSSIFFIADSVVKGCFIIAYTSILFRFGTDFRGYFGARASFNVLGR